MIKNKRLKPEIEKIELELFKQGEFVINDDEEREDPLAPTLIKEEEKPVEIAPGELTAPVAYTGSTTNVHPWLSSMVNYAQPIKFLGFDVADSKHREFIHSFIVYPLPIYLAKNNVFLIRINRFVILFLQAKKNW